MKRFFAAIILVSLLAFTYNTDITVIDAVDNKKIKNIDAAKIDVTENIKNMITDSIETISTNINKLENKKELGCLANNVFFEARNQPILGKVSIAHVTLTRAKNEKLNVCNIVYKKSSNGCQFTWVCKSKKYKNNSIEQKAKKESLAIAYLVYNNKIVDPTNGATHYYNPKLANPSWAKKMVLTNTIGDHNFLKSNTSIIEATDLQYK